MNLQLTNNKHLLKTFNLKINYIETYKAVNKQKLDNIKLHLKN